MRYESRVERSLAVTHHVPGLPGHDARQHPHWWTLIFFFDGTPLAAEGMGVLPGDHHQILGKVLNEYDSQDLNALIGAGIPSMEGFALHLMERLSGPIPELRRISIFDAYSDPRERRGFAVSRDP